MITGLRKSIFGVMFLSGIAMAVTPYDPHCIVTLVAKENDAYTQIAGQPANFKDSEVIGSNAMDVFSGTNTAVISDIDKSWSVHMSKSTLLTIGSSRDSVSIDLQYGKIVIQDDRRLFKAAGLGFSTRKFITKSKRIVAGSKATTYCVSRVLDDTTVEALIGTVVVTYRGGTKILNEKDVATFDANGDLVRSPFKGHAQKPLKKRP